MLHEELTRTILEACFEVSNELGVGFVESVYEKALVLALQQKGLKTQRQAELIVKFRGVEVGKFLADLLVENKVIVELKAVSGLTNEH
jgi:GxxExxY protein